MSGSTTATSPLTVTTTRTTTMDSSTYVTIYPLQKTKKKKKAHTKPIY